MKERAEVLKEEVRCMVKGSKEVSEILDLVLTLQRLGLDSYYKTELDDLLYSIYNSDFDDKDLNLVSLRFYLLRKNGYDVSSGKSFIGKIINRLLKDSDKLILYFIKLCRYISMFQRQGWKFCC